MAMTTEAGRQRGRGAAAALALLVTLALCLPAPLHAQGDTNSGRSWIVSFSHYGKWAALAGAAGFTTVALFRNDDADAIFRGLVTLCRSAPESCELGDDGSYRDPDAERLFQETRRLDSQARAWMIAGQVTLVAAGGMFLIDLIAGDEGPRNIPFTPFEVINDPRRLGLRVRF